MIYFWVCLWHSCLITHLDRWNKWIKNRLYILWIQTNRRSRRISYTNVVDWLLTGLQIQSLNVWKATIIKFAFLLPRRNVKFQGNSHLIIYFDYNNFCFIIRDYFPIKTGWKFIRSKLNNKSTNISGRDESWTKEPLGQPQNSELRMTEMIDSHSLRKSAIACKNLISQLIYCD